MTRPVNIAVIGAGIGRQHVDALLTLQDTYRIAAVCDLVEERGRELAEHAGANFTSQSSDILNDAEIDIVDICLPPHLHFTFCKEALEAGKHVVCEKPLATSLADVDELAEISKRTGYQVFPVFQYRFGENIAKLRALIDQGLTGELHCASLETHWNRDHSYYEPEWRGTWAGEQGGAVLCHAIHIHDLLSYIGGPVDRVFAETATRINPIETEDCAALTIKMKTGALVTSSITLGASDDTSRLRLVFDKITVESGRSPYAPGVGRWMFGARNPDHQNDLDLCLDNVVCGANGYIGMFAQIHNALSGKMHRAVTLEDGRRSVEFVSAVYQSSRRGVPVQLPIGQDNEFYRGWAPI